jgi:hypothetical protein
LYSFFWVIPRGLNFMYRYFGTISLFHLHRWCQQEEQSSCWHHLRKWNRQSVPKRRYMKFRRRGVIRKREYIIQNTAKVWNQEGCTSICSYVASDVNLNIDNINGVTWVNIPRIMADIHGIIWNSHQRDSTQRLFVSIDNMGLTRTVITFNYFLKQVLSLHTTYLTVLCIKLMLEV